MNILTTGERNDDDRICWNKENLSVFKELIKIRYENTKPPSKISDKIVLRRIKKVEESEKDLYYTPNYLQNLISWIQKSFSF